jgi:hypothetical protein
VLAGSAPTGAQTKLSSAENNQGIAGLESQNKKLSKNQKDGCNDQDKLAS